MDRKLRELMKASLEISAYLERVSDYAPSRIVGTSEDGLVDITVDRDGHISNCTIAEDWSRTVDPSMLESDINDALTQAQSQRMELLLRASRKTISLTHRSATTRSPAQSQNNSGTSRVGRAFSSTESPLKSERISLHSPIRFLTATSCPHPGQRPSTSP